MSEEWHTSRSGGGGGGGGGPDRAPAEPAALALLVRRSSIMCCSRATTSCCISNRRRSTLQSTYSGAPHATCPAANQRCRKHPTSSMVDPSQQSSVDSRSGSAPW